MGVAELVAGVCVDPNPELAGAGFGPPNIPPPPVVAPGCEKRELVAAGVDDSAGFGTPKAGLARDPNRDLEA